MFQHDGTVQFVWDVPNGNPTILNVYDDASNATIYRGVADGSEPGSFSVSSVDSVYSFCLTIPANASIGPIPVVTIVGDLQYSTQGPLL
ncbi:MAG: hypothetical protein ACLQD8_05445 [Thermoplasmata archaeon]